MNLLRGFLAAIRENPELFDKYYGRIEKQSERLLDLINSLLRLARAGRVIDSREPVNISKIINELYYDYKDRDINIKVENRLPNLEIKGDPKSLLTVFDNLMDNAVKYRDPEKERLEVSVDFEKAGSKGRIIFKDNGSGIENEDIDRIFSPGVVLSKDKGTGFGLAIVRKIIDAHGGRIKACSKGAGKGVTFRIEFPIDDFSTQ